MHDDVRPAKEVAVIIAPGSICLAFARHIGAGRSDQTTKATAGQLRGEGHDVATQRRL